MAKGEFRAIAEHIETLGISEVGGPDTWREARDIDEGEWFEHLGHIYDTLQALTVIASEDTPEIVQGVIASAIQWGFEMAVVRYGSDPR